MQLVLKAYKQAFLKEGGNITVVIVLTCAHGLLTDYLRTVTWLTGLLAGQVTTPGYINVAYPLPS
jgi:hypothetical protein